MSKPTFDTLMNNAELRAHFITDTGITDEDLRDALKDEAISDLIGYLKDEFEVFNYATENGHCEVIEWRGVLLFRKRVGRAGGAIPDARRSPGPDQVPARVRRRVRY